MASKSCLAYQRDTYTGHITAVCTSVFSDQTLVIMSVVPPLAYLAAATVLTTRGNILAGLVNWITRVRERLQNRNVLRLLGSKRPRETGNRRNNVIMGLYDREGPELAGLYDLDWYRRRRRRFGSENMSEFFR